MLSMLISASLFYIIAIVTFIIGVLVMIVNAIRNKSENAEMGFALLLVSLGILLFAMAI